MNPNEASTKIKLKVGVFVALGILFAGYMTVYVNDRPFWWRTCQSASITVDDATGLKKKSPVKSLGLEIGYIQNVDLAADGVRIQLCITAPVSIMPDTRYYVRAEGFLGDKFLELKPMKVEGNLEPANHLQKAEPPPNEMPTIVPTVTPVGGKSSAVWTTPPLRIAAMYLSRLSSVAEAQNIQGSSTEIPGGAKGADIQQVVNQMNSLMTEVKGVTTNLREALDPNEIKSAVKQLNKTLENASNALSPEGGLTNTARRALLKLEDAIEQARDQLTRVNQGKGSVGMVLNDPEYAEEAKKALKGINKILGRAADLRFVVSLAFDQLTAYDGSRGSFGLKIWPRPDRFYQIGIGTDPRGNIFQTTTTTEVGGVSTTVNSTRIERGGFALTAMVGTKLGKSLEVALGILNSDGVARAQFNLGWDEYRESLQLFTDLYFRPFTANGTWTVTPNARVGLTVQPISIFTLSGGLEGVKTVGGKASYFFGAGIRFDDEDIKLLTAFF